MSKLKLRVILGKSNCEHKLTITHGDKLMASIVFDEIRYNKDSHKAELFVWADNINGEELVATVHPCVSVLFNKATSE